MNVRWFAFLGSIHAVDEQRTAARGAIFTICGIRPMVQPTDASMKTMADHEIPPSGDGFSPCRTCLTEVALGSTSDEPLDDAVARGYVGSRHEMI